MVIHPIIIIGAGPAGISIAVEAIKKGFKTTEVLILEKSDYALSTITEKYPEEKLVFANYKGIESSCLGELCIQNMTKAEFIHYMDSVIDKNKLDIKFNQTVLKITKLKNNQIRVDTIHDTFIANSLFVAIGNGAKPRRLDIDIPIELEPSILYDIQTLTKNIHESVLVVGGGDSASEYTQILKQRGFSVSLSYRKFHFDKMLEDNKVKVQELIKTNKITFFANSEIKKIQSGLAHKLSVTFSNDEVREFDYIVMALGNERPAQYLRTLGIQLHSEVGDEYTESNIEGIFVVGDLALGNKGGSIIKAFNGGVRALESACQLYLDCKN